MITSAIHIISTHYSRVSKRKFASNRSDCDCLCNISWRVLFYTYMTTWANRRKKMQKCDGKEKPIILGCKNNTLNSSIIQLFIFLLVWTMIWISYAYFRIMMNADTFQSRVNNLNIAQKKMDVQTKRSNGASACL